MVTIDRLNRNAAAVGASMAVPEITQKNLLTVFLLTILLPMSFQVAGLQLSPVRLFLLVAIVPLCVQLLSKRFGRIVASDWLLLLAGVWVVVALLTNHGLERLPFAGITAVEAIGGYLVGRAFVRNEADFRYVFSFMVMAMLVLLPFTLVENVTGKLVISDILRQLPGVDAPYRGNSAYGRLGLERVYGVFAHPILWGLFCSLAFANVISLSKQPTFMGNAIKLMFPVAIVGYSTFSALSSAPLLSVGLQMMLLTWGFVMGGRWKLLCCLIVLAYIGVDALSNRTPVTILFETLTFNSGTAWTRVAIFEFGSAAAMRNPIFGVGFNGYDLPHWLTSSVDNFWLVLALRYGLVGFALWGGAFLSVLVAGAFAKIRDAHLSKLRRGYLIALSGVILTLITVHIWEQAAVFIMFYLGAGVWLYNDGDPSPDEATQGATEEPGARRYRYSRFPPKSEARLASQGAR